jgi:hypothetical protein
VLVGDGEWAVTGERRAAGRHLVEHDAQGVEIAARIERRTLGLLGGEVGGRAHHLAGLGQVLFDRAVQGAGDAEVRHLHDPAGRDQDVAGLDVAVHDAVAVCEPQRGGDIGGHIGRPFRLQAAFGAEDVGQAAAVHELHHDVVRLRLLAPVVDAHDVGVVQVGGGLGLAPEALHERRVGGVLGEEHLHGDGPVEQQVPRQEDVGHPSPAGSS